MLTDLRDRRVTSSCRIALVCLAVADTETSAVTTIQAHSPNAQRQHLLSDGLKWTAPVVSFKLFEPPRDFVYAVSAVFPCTNLCSESWLYNRPPPTC